LGGGLGKSRTSAGKHSHGQGLLVIGAFKILEGLLLLAVGIGVLRLLHKDVAEVVTHWVNYLRVDPDNVFIHKMLKHLEIVDDKKLREFGIGTFIYSGVRFTEGIGLMLRQKWAEYLTVILTGALIPLEVWEIIKHTTGVKIAVLIINIVIVIYLIVELRRNGNGETARRKESA
jgi:uncharacterized membrane protein (DUF2068 family)